MIVQVIGVQTSWFCEQSTVFRRRKEGKGREEGVRREREKCGCIGRGGEECGKEGERRVENHGGATKESYDQERIHREGRREKRKGRVGRVQEEGRREE